MALKALPIEIREHILELALLADNTEPPNDALTLTKELREVELQEDDDLGTKCYTLTAGEYTFLRKRRWDDFESLPSSSSLPVFHRAGTCRDTTLPLLLVSRQIHTETKGILARKMFHSSWNADVMFIKNVGLWTTWLSASRLVRNVDTVHAQFRSFNAPEALDPAFFRGHMWAAGCGGPAVGVWGFYDLLVGLLEGTIGPFHRQEEVEGSEDDEDGRRIDNRGITVKRLVIDCLSSTEESILPLNHTGRGRAYVLDARHLDPAIPERKRAALVLAEFFSCFLRTLMSPAQYDLNESKILFERVGEIFIRVDGEPFRHFDISEILPLLWWRGGESLYSNKLVLVNKAFQWKERAFEKRQQAGFRVVQQ